MPLNKETEPNLNKNQLEINVALLFVAWLSIVQFNILVFQVVLVGFLFNSILTLVGEWTSKLFL